MSSATRSGLCVVETKPQVMTRSRFECRPSHIDISRGSLRDLEALDLQVMLGMAEAEIARVVGEADILGDLVQHALVERGIAPGHAGLELGPPADRAVHEQAEAHPDGLCGQFVELDDVVAQDPLAQLGAEMAGLLRR